MSDVLSRRTFVKAITAAAVVGSLESGAQAEERTATAGAPTEWAWTSGHQYDDPFNQVEVDAIVTLPSGAEERIPGFWSGGSTWRVRYAPRTAGTYKVRSACSDTKNRDLHDQQLTLHVEPYGGANAHYKHGPLKVGADGRHFAHADGTPFFWLGDTWWMGLCHRLRFPEDFGRLTEDRKRKGFNVVQLVAGLYPDMHPFDPRGANEAGFPWEPEYARIHPEYFDAADDRLRHLIEQGITPCIVGAWGYFMGWMGEEKLKAHWRYLIARYAAWPVVWCAAGEANLPWYRAENFPYDDQTAARRWCEVMRTIRESDPCRRPLTIHPTAINSYSARHVVDDESLLDFDFLQTPHDGPGTTVEEATARTVVQSRAASPVMPVINGEASYENLLDRVPAARTRAMFWLCMLNGAAGHTYGANGIWQVNRKGQPHGPSPSEGSPPTGYGTIAWDEAMHLPGGRQIAAGKAWLERLDWHTFRPHFSWAAWAETPRAAPGAAPVTAAPPAPGNVAPCAMGRTDGPRVFYMLEARDVLLRQLEPGRTYRISLFDPVETTESSGGDRTADYKGEIRLSAPGHQHDWAAHLTPLP